MHPLLTALPSRWQGDRLLLGDRVRWDVAAVRADDDAVLVATRRQGRVTLLGRGAPVAVARHLTGLVGDPGAGSLLASVRWMSVPRGTALDQRLLDAVGLAAFSTWDWMATDGRAGLAQVAEPADRQVRRLDPVADAPAIRACLAAANPDTSARPEATDEAGWWGVDAPGGGRLLGVVGASLRGGDPSGSDLSWHLHGLGVLPQARGAGLGAALTAAATRAGLDGAADWVSLGLYASNDVARRVYRRLGFVTEGEFSSYGPAGSVRPPH